MIDNIEYMNKKTKMILSVVGVCAVIVPALLLWYLSSNSKQEPKINNSKRPVSAATVQNTQNKPVATTRPVAATPTPAATSSAAPQGTSSAR